MKNQNFRWPEVDDGRTAATVGLRLWANSDNKWTAATTEHGQPMVAIDGRTTTTTVETTGQWRHCLRCEEGGRRYTRRRMYRGGGIRKIRGLQLFYTIRLKDRYGLKLISASGSPKGFWYI